MVLDTNVLISGLFSTASTPARALERAINSGQLVASTATLRELMTELFSPKFDRYVPRERRDALLLPLAPPIEIVEVVRRVHASSDPDDDKFLEVAIDGRVDVIVSGDGDLPDLNAFRGIAILARPITRIARRRESSGR